MEVTKLINNKKFDEVRKILENKPYDLIIKEDADFPNLYMITYDKEKGNLDEKLVRECRGIILEKNTNKVICYTFNKSIKLNDKFVKDFDWNSVRIEKSIDGSQIKLFYYNDKWNCATTRCIDADKAYWGSDKSFYQLFRDVEKEIDYDKLDKKYCYSFILCHPENRIVIKYEKPILFHVLTRNLETLREIEVNIDVKQAPICTNFGELGELFEEVKKMENMEEGYIICDKNYNRIKVKNEGYKKIKKIRGNTSNMLYRYLQLKHEGRESIKNYLKYYGEDRGIFNLYELDLYNLARDLHRIYISKHVKKTGVYIQPYFKKFIYKLHGIYLSNYKRIMLDKVVEELNKLGSKQICYMYNCYYKKN